MPPKAKLTPIHIRGKDSKRKKAWQPPNPEKFKEKQRLRALKRLQSSKNAGNTSLTNLESLPAEVLLSVALAAGNPSLLYSSPVFYRRLHNKSFFQELILLKFGPTWDIFWGDTAGTVATRLLRPDWVNDDDIARQQSQILAAPWCDLNTMLEAQQWWYARRGFRKESLDYHAPWHANYHVHYFPKGFLAHPELGMLPGFSSEDLRYFRDEGDYGSVARQQHKNSDLRIRDMIEKDFFMFQFPSVYRPLNDSENLQTAPTSDFAFPKRGPQYCDVHKNVHIPNRLLRGPWRWKDAAMLYWLLRSGARRQHRDHTWELTRKGFYNIMRTKDERLASLLLRLCVVMEVFVDTNHWPWHIRLEALAYVDDEIRRVGSPTMPLLEAQHALRACNSK